MYEWLNSAQNTRNTSANTAKSRSLNTDTLELKTKADCSPVFWQSDQWQTCHILFLRLNLLVFIKINGKFVQTYNNNDWHVYIVLCADNTLYTGVALDPVKREKEHNCDNKKAARYTRSRRPVRLVYIESCLSRSQACSRETEIKKLNRLAKDTLIGSKDWKLSKNEQPKTETWAAQENCLALTS